MSTKNFEYFYGKEGGVSNKGLFCSASLIHTFSLMIHIHIQVQMVAQLSAQLNVHLSKDVLGELMLPDVLSLNFACQ